MKVRQILLKLEPMLRNTSNSCSKSHGLKCLCFTRNKCLYCPYKSSIERLWYIFDFIKECPCGDTSTERFCAVSLDHFACITQRIGNAFAMFVRPVSESLLYICYFPMFLQTAAELDELILKAISDREAASAELRQVLKFSHLSSPLAGHYYQSPSWDRHIGEGQYCCLCLFLSTFHAFAKTTAQIHGMGDPQRIPFQMQKLVHVSHVHGRNTIRHAQYGSQECSSAQRYLHDVVE